jgi:hypothetical protein
MHRSVHFFGQVHGASGLAGRVARLAQERGDHLTVCRRQGPSKARDGAVVAGEAVRDGVQGGGGELDEDEAGPGIAP